MHRLFTYRNGYTFLELKEMCEPYESIRLPFLKRYNIGYLLGEYIFGRSMNRFPFGGKNVLRRLLGCMFEPKLIIEGNGADAFVFTGDGKGRPDYVDGIKKVAEQCHSSRYVWLNRSQLSFKPWRVLCIFPVLIWATALKKNTPGFLTRIDMSTSLFRAVLTGRRLFHAVNSADRVTVFCDAWSSENYLVQRLVVSGVPTATLQHGNGTEIFYGSCSDCYLANSLLSEKNAADCGVPAERIRVLGPMKYAGQTFEHRLAADVQKIGIVFDGADNYENNVEMLQTVHRAVENTSIHCLIRFHPNNHREDYRPFLMEQDNICDSLSELENSIDLCVVYNSSMYTDMIYKKLPVLRFKNGKRDLFPTLQDRGFSSVEELTALLKWLEQSPDAFLREQQELFEQVYGANAGPESYHNFYREWSNPNGATSADQCNCSDL